MRFPEKYDLDYIKNNPNQLFVQSGRFLVKNEQGELIELSQFNPNSRQKNIIKEMPENILIIGAGGVGANLAYMFARTYKPDIVIFDKDKIEITNLERLDFLPHTVGLYKATVLKEHLYDLFNYEITAIPHHFKIEYFQALPWKPELIIDGTDNIEIQRETFLYCKNNNIRFLKVGTFQNRLTITDDVPLGGFDTKIEERTCVQGAPQWAPTQLAAAAEILSLLTTSKPIEINIHIFHKNTIPGYEGEFHGKQKKEEKKEEENNKPTKTKGEINASTDPASNPTEQQNSEIQTEGISNNN